MNMQMGLAIVMLELTSLKLYYGDDDTTTELNAGHNPVLARGTLSFRWWGHNVPVPSMDSNFVSRGEKQHLMNPTNMVVGQTVPGSQFTVRAPMRCSFQAIIQFHALDQEGSVEEQFLGESSITGYITNNQPQVLSFYETAAGMNMNMRVQWTVGGI